ncbi:MAG: AMP-binding protein [Actinomycetota bacterium]
MTPSGAPVTLRSRRELSPIQRALYASQQRDPHAPVLTMARLAHIDGPVDGDRLRTAFAAVVAASDALRTRIAPDDDGVTTVTLSAEPAPTAEIELARADAETWAAARARAVIPIAERAHDSVLLRHEDGTASWYLGLHHCVTDATGWGLVFTAVAAAYEGTAPDIDSYYAWARPDGESDRHRSPATAHWLERQPAPRIGHLYERNRPVTTDSVRRQVDLADGLDDRIDRALTGPYRLLTPDLSWAALLTTVTAAYLHRVTGATEFALGLPVHNRRTPETRAQLGPLVEVYPVDVTVEPGETFTALHRRVARAVNRTLTRAEPGCAPAGNDIEAVVNVTPDVERFTIAGHDVSMRSIDNGAIDRNHLLRVQRFGYADDPLALDLNTAAVDPDDAARAVEHFRTVLDAAVTTPDAAIDADPILTRAERDALRSWGSGPPVGRAPLVVDRLRAGLAGRDHVALVDGDRRWTGNELWNEIVGAAADLRRSGIGAGDRVGLEMHRSAEAVVAIYAVLAAGASYVPLDPDQPEARRTRLAERAGCVRRLQDLRLVGSAPPGDADDLPAIAGDDEAYLLFTSGSTGEPKGVPITHQGLADYVDFAVDAYVGAEPPVIPLFSALTFDLTVTSLFTATVTGGRLVVVGGDGPAAVATIATTPELTWCKATPSHLELLVRLLPDDHGIETLVVGGEAFLRPLADGLRERLPGVRIFNEYGPTEAVVGCMIFEDDPTVAGATAEIPIGRPAPGVELRIVDTALHDVPIGAPGELLISSRGVTAGYLDPDPDAFVELDGRRWYRSGDLVRLIDPDTAVYLRRIDEQLKIGGIRLDPSEVEAALAAHPAIRRAAVRPWSPGQRHATRHCTRCGLADNVPGVVFDDLGVCDRCHAYDTIAPQAEAYFRTLDDLAIIRDRAKLERTGDVDAITLLSGGKDSTYVLYQLVAMGFDVHALTLDNGFISDDAKTNIAKTVEHLGVSHEFATTDAMNAIFRDSLDRFSNVCQGCFKTIYTLATARADELGAPLVVTGLSRGQLFETRLIPAQFEEGRFDADAIDAAVLAARKAYHRVDDAVGRLLDTSVFDGDDVFDRIAFVDFYRYVDVELAEMLRFLDEDAPWVRPSDTGRSTNCRINAAGIQTHLTEQGYHNYAEPYAWDVRLGHKQRDEALEELDDRDDADEVAAMLDEVAYAPRRRSVLTAWIETEPTAATPTPGELRAHLQQLLPAHAIPDSFVAVDELAMTTNGKLDTDALPAPERRHRSSSGVMITPTSPTEQTIVELWQRHLGVEPISTDDDFFALGGDSLAAIEMSIHLADALQADIPDAIVFANATPRLLASAVDAHLANAITDPDGAATEAVDAGPLVDAGDTPPRLTDAERAMLDQAALDADDPRYNQGRVFVVDAALDPDRLRRAIAAVIERHQPLQWSFATPRRRLDLDAALAFDTAASTDEETADAEALRWHRMPYDLEHGPLVRVRVRPLDTDAGDARTHVFIGTHHVSTDEASFIRLWREVEAAYHGDPLPPLPVSHADHAVWQAARRTADAATFWSSRPAPATSLPLHHPLDPEPDGLRSRVTDLSATELRAAGGSPFGTAAGALALALRALSGDANVDFGAIVSTRDHPTANPLIGYHLATLPLVVDTGTEATTLDEVRRAASDDLAAALAHRTVPLADIASARRRAGAEPAMPGILLAIQEIDELRFGPHAARQEIAYTGSAVADASLFVQLRDGRVELAIEHRGTVIGAATADHLLAVLDHALTAVIREPSRAVGAWLDHAPSMPTLDGGPAPDADTVLDRLAAHVAADPDGTAVRIGTRTLSRAELDTWADAIAAELADAGVRPGDRVGMATGRTIGAVPAIVGILRSGAAYVPIDPEYPAERNRAIVDASAVTIAVTAEDGQADLPPSIRAVAIGRDVPTEARPFEARVVDPSATAYVIHTSGSTGTPRGVAVDHHRLALSTAARGPVYGDDPDDFLLVSSFAFDSSIAGLFWALSTGATVTLPTESEVHDVDALVDLLASGPTHTLLVPSLYAAVLRRSDDRGPWPRQVIVAGEATTSELVDEHARRRPDTRLTNEYGPTEATVWATSAHLEPGSISVPIGTPIPGTWATIVDGDRPVGPGLIGELVIGGDLVTEGYDDGASDRFLAESRHGSGRAFRTGDLAAVVDGRIHFHGRNDDQLNVGGVRVEPTEVEATLARVDGVATVVATTVDIRPLADRIADGPPDRLAAAMASAAEAPDPAAALTALLADPDRARLVAHVETDGQTVDPADLRAAAIDALPAAARPVHYEFHDALPRTPNGKADRRAVAVLPVAVGDTAVPPAPIDTDPDLAELAEMARTVLTDRLGVRPTLALDDDLFDAGLDSLAALELLLAFENRFGVRTRISVLLANRTIARLGGALGLGEATAVDEGAVIVVNEGAGAQPPLWLLPGAGAEVVFFHQLASRLDPRRSVLSVPYPGIDGSRPPHDNVEDLAADVLEVIRANQPHGPYAFFAYSVGGLVAVEMAKHLEAEGETVSFIGAVESGLGTAGDYRSRSEKAKDLLRDGGYGALLGRLGAGVGRRIRNQPWRISHRVRIATEESAMRRLGLRPSDWYIYDRMYHVTRAAGLRYRPPHVDAPVTVFLAEDSSDLWRETMAAAWAPVTDELEIRIAPGSHDGHTLLVDPDNAGAMAAFIDERLGHR